MYFVKGFAASCPDVRGFQALIILFLEQEG
jgi:hypothetical protein